MLEGGCIKEQSCSARRKKDLKESQGQKVIKLKDKQN